MSFASIQSQFLSLLDRSDCTPAQATTFIQQAIERIQRVVRLPNMERMQVWTNTASPMTFIAIPPDLIQVKDIYVTLPAGYISNNSGVIVPSLYQQLPGLQANGLLGALRQVSYRELLVIPPSGLPEAYARLQSTFQFRGAVMAGSTIELSYYGAFSQFSSPSADNEITASAPDLVTYGALSIGGDFYSHPRTDAWEARYQAYLAEVTQMGEDVDRHGGPMVLENPHAEYI